MILNKLKQNKYPTGILLLTILILGLLVPQYGAQAFFHQLTVSISFNVIVSWFVTSIVNPTIAMSIAAVQILLYQTNYFPDQVAASWNLMRNFLNMFFIVILIVMAFGTIFDVEKYRLGSLLPKFLIAAMLINFSFVIGKYIIAVANGLSNVFLSSIPDILATLGQGLSQQAITNFSGIGTGQLAATGILYLIFLIISLIAYATIAIFLLVRIPFLWFLLILSPVAWLGLILPDFKAKTWGVWWENFIGWTFFLPVYMFFLMFATIFINAKNQIAPPSVSQTQLEKFFGDYGINDIFMFAITIIIMIGGLGLAAKMSFFAGTRAVKIFGGIEGGVKRFFPGSRSVRGAYAGAKQTIERVQKEGLPGWKRYLYGGERGERLRTEKWEQRFSRTLGYTPELKLQKQQVSDIDTEVNRLKDLEKAGELTVNADFETRTAATDPNNVRGAAMRALLYERGRISTPDFRSSMEVWTDRNPFIAQSMSERAAKGNYGGLDRNELVRMTGAQGVYSKFAEAPALSARKEWLDFIKKDDRALSSPEFNANIFTRGMDIFGGPATNDGREFRKEIAKKRPDLVAEYDIKSGHWVGPNQPQNVSDAVYRIINRKSPSDLAEVLNPAMNDPNFQNAMFNLLQQKQTNNPANPAQNYPGGGIDFKRKLIDTLDPQRSNIIRGITSANIP